MKTLMVMLLMCISITTCFADGTPSVKAKVNSANGITTYSYTITNNTASTIDTFDVFMPEAGARAVTSFKCPGTTLWNDYSFRGDWSSWAVGMNIAPGASKTAILTTAASVPTSYTFKPFSYSSNWCWNSMMSNPGNSLIPVPVPEPSSILALVGGTACLGGLVLRRRR